MPSFQNFTFVSILLTLLIAIVSANPLLVKEKEGSQVGDVDQLLQLLDQIDPPALHAALHDFSPKKFKHGVFQEDWTALKAVHRVDAAAATNIISLAKRLGSADNSSSTGQQAPSSTINALSTTTVVAGESSPVSTVTKTASSNVAPLPVGPATATSTSAPAGGIGSTSTVVAPSTVLVTSTLSPSSAGASSGSPAGSQSSNAAVGGVPVSSGASSQASSGASQGSTQASSTGGTLVAGSVITSTDAAGVTMVSTIGGGAASFGSVVTSTDARGLTIVSTIGGGVVTIQPSGSPGATPSSAGASPGSSNAAASPSSSAAPQSSHTSVFLQTTMLPGGGQSTITAVTVVAGPAAPTPSGSVSAKSGTSTTSAPGLQSGGAVASRMVGWELAGLLGGAMGVAMVL